jgi:hypothetical protein
MGVSPRDESIPTVQQLEEERRQQQGNRHLRQTPVWDVWRPGVVVASLIAFCVFCIAIHIAQEHRIQCERLLSAPTVSALPLSPDAHEEERSLDFDDPSPILAQNALNHLVRYGGHATIKENGHREFRNRFTDERIVTTGQLRRFQAMLDISGDSFDPSSSDEELRRIMRRVMQDLLDYAKRGPTTTQNVTLERSELCPVGK